MGPTPERSCLLAAGAVAICKPSLYKLSAKWGAKGGEEGKGGGGVQGQTYPPLPQADFLCFVPYCASCSQFVLQLYAFIHYMRLSALQVDNLMSLHPKLYCSCVGVSNILQWRRLCQHVCETPRINISKRHKLLLHFISIHSLRFCLPYNDCCTLAAGVCLLGPGSGHAALLAGAGVPGGLCTAPP